MGDKRYDVQLTFRRMDLPPVRDALVLGKRAPVGSTGVVRALQAMSPGAFRLIKVDHPVIESVLVREADLRKIPEEEFLAVVLEEAAAIMDDTDALNVEVDVAVTVRRALRGE